MKDLNKIRKNLLPENLPAMQIGSYWQGSITTRRQKCMNVLLKSAYKDREVIRTDANVVHLFP